MQLMVVKSVNSMYASDCTSTVFVHILVCTCISKNTFMYILVCILKYLVYTIINYQNKTLYFQLIFHVLSCKSNTIKNRQKKSTTV